VPPVPPAPSAPSTRTAPPAAAGELRAEFSTDRGKFIVQLRTEEAPTACANFVNLIQRNYYNNQPINSWTRVIRHANVTMVVNRSVFVFLGDFSY
jgi:hypothetical protein